MCTECTDTAGAFLEKHVCRFGKRAGRIYDVIDQDDVTSFDITDDCHFCDVVRFRAVLIADDHFRIEILCITADPVHATHIRSCKRQVGQIEGLDIRNKER